MQRHYEPMLMTILLFQHDLHVKWICGEMSDDAYKAELVQSADKIKREGERCGLPALISIAEKMSRYASAKDTETRTVMAICNSMVGDIQQELVRHYYLRIPFEDRRFYTHVLLSERAAAAFPSAIEDIRAAGRCYALDESTACVMHCMRALEVGIAALTKALKFTPSNPNWETVLNECEREIKKIGPQTSSTWKEDQAFYSEAALNFRYFKNAWRNHVMHGRESYTRPDALEILNHVLSFMDHLSSRLSE